MLVENYRPGVLAEMGFDAARLDALNPRLVVASTNGYGSDGPYVDRPAFGVVNALRARDLNGVGRRVEAPMMFGIMSTFAYLASDHLATGKLPERSGNDHPISSPYGLFRCADGDIAIAPSTESILRRLLSTLGIEALLAEPRFATNTDRMRHRAEINGAIESKLAADTCAARVRRLNAAGVPCGVVQDVDQALSDPQVLHQEMVMDVPHPGHGTVRMLGFPVKLSGTPCRVRHPAPDHGAHTREVLAALGRAPRDARPPREEPPE